MMMAEPTFLLLLLMGGQVGVPFGLPPAPEDPVMASVAPQECLWYFTWSGAAEPNPKSTNQTEQLLAEPEVRDFVHSVGKALSAAIRKGAPPTPQGKLLGTKGPGLIHILLTHPTALFISKVSIGPRGPDIAGGIVVGTGNETDEVKATLAQLEQTLLGPAAAPGADAAAKWHKLPSPPGAPVVEWGFHGKYLIVGIGEGSAEAIAGRTEGPPPAWLVAIKKKLPVERVSTVHYLNVKKVIAVAEPFLGPGPGRAILAALGLDKVQQFANVSGLDGTGCLSKSWVQFDGEPTGLLTLFGPEPLTAADLAPIPKDASFAIAARMKPDQLWSSIVDGIKKIDPQAGQRFDTDLKRAEGELGFRLQEDLFQTLGDSWCIYNSPGEGGLLITGLTIVVPVKNHDRLVKTNEQIIELARKTMPNEPLTPSNRFSRNRGPSIHDTTFQKQKIYYLNFGQGVPFVLAWCITDKQLIFSLSPQNIRALLSRDTAAGSLADLPAVAAKLRTDHPIVLSYQDSAGTLKIVYPVVQMFATAVFSEIQREGLDLDAAMLPSLASLIRHVEPGLSTLSREKSGLLYVSRQSMPVDLSVTGLVPLWTGAMFMSVREARSSAQFREESIQESIQVEQSSRARAIENDRRIKERIENRKLSPEEDAERKEEHAPRNRPVPEKKTIELQPSNR